MKHLMTVLALAVAAFSTSAFAADAMTKQQSKMGACNTDAGDKKGDERKAFMKTCLSAKKATQQDKMKMCNMGGAYERSLARIPRIPNCAGTESSVRS